MANRKLFGDGIYVCTDTKCTEDRIIYSTQDFFLHMSHNGPQPLNTLSIYVQENIQHVDDFISQHDLSSQMEYLDNQKNIILKKFETQIQVFIDRMKSERFIETQNKKNLLNAIINKDLSEFSQNIDWDVSFLVDIKDLPDQSIKFQQVNKEARADVEKLQNALDQFWNLWALNLSSIQSAIFDALDMLEPGKYIRQKEPCEYSPGIFNQQSWQLEQSLIQYQQDVFDKGSKKNESDEQRQMTSIGSLLVLSRNDDLLQQKKELVNKLQLNKPIVPGDTPTGNFVQEEVNTLHNNIYMDQFHNGPGEALEDENLEIGPQKIKGQKKKINKKRSTRQAKEIQQERRKKKASNSVKVELMIDRNTNKKTLKPCKCTKSKCLKLYCRCFHNGQPCGEQCQCTDCGNVRENGEVINSAVERVYDRLEKINQNSKSPEELFNILKVLGCKCDKTNCEKKYCDCFRIGQKCTEACGCDDVFCRNAKYDDQ